MFGLGIPEILFILLLAALILGPEHMPRAARMIGRWSSKLRSAATTFGNAVASDADLSGLKTDLSDVKKEIESAKKELLAPKKELEQVSSKTHEAFLQAREELKVFQASTGRDADNLPKSSDLSDVGCDKAVSAEPVPSAFMSRPIGGGDENSDLKEKTGLRSVKLSKARFLPEEISRVVVKRRIELSEPKNCGIHRQMMLERSRTGAAFLRVRKLERPVNEVISDQKRVKLV